jgi:hypothetical protein
VSRERNEYLETYEIRPSGAIVSRTMEVDATSVLRDRRRDEAVLLLSPPSLHYPKMRALPLRLSPRPFAAFFSGDGEALDMEEGPEKDWRVNPDLEDEPDPDAAREEIFERMVDERYAALDEESSLRALHRVQNGLGVQEMAGPYSLLITVAFVSVAVVLLLISWSFIDSRGGLGEAINIDSLLGGGA